MGQTEFWRKEPNFDIIGFSSIYLCGRDFEIDLLIIQPERNRSKGY